MMSTEIGFGDSIPCRGQPEAARLLPHQRPGGKLVPQSDVYPADRQLICLERFVAKVAAEITPLITAEVIEEHRRDPLGRHSDDLERILNFFRKGPSFALYSRVPCREFQVIRLPITPGAGPMPIDDVVYTDEDEAMHAVFLHHIALLAPATGAGR